MISCDDSKSPLSGYMVNCTTASTFEKTNSLKLELLFGNFQKKIQKNSGSQNVINEFDYLFLPSQIFGFAYLSKGIDFRKFHHVFVLRCCVPGENVSLITGISPGAEVLVKTMTHAASFRLRSILKKLAVNQIDFASVSISQYRHLNRLLEINARTDFFVDELIEKASTY